MKLREQFPDLEIRKVLDKSNGVIRYELIQRWGERENTVWIPLGDLHRVVEEAKRARVRE